MKDSKYRIICKNVLVNSSDILNKNRLIGAILKDWLSLKFQNCAKPDQKLMKVWKFWKLALAAKF